MSEADEVFNVERILDKHVDQGVLFYFVKWQGYPDSDNTWEPADSIDSPEKIAEYESSLLAQEPQNEDPPLAAENSSSHSSDVIEPEPPKPPEPACEEVVDGGDSSNTRASRSKSSKKRPGHESTETAKKQKASADCKVDKRSHATVRSHPPTRSSRSSALEKCSPSLSEPSSEDSQSSATRAARGKSDKQPNTATATPAAAKKSTTCDAEPAKSGKNLPAKRKGQPLSVSLSTNVLKVPIVPTALQNGHSESVAVMIMSDSRKVMARHTGPNDNGFKQKLGFKEIVGATNVGDGIAFLIQFEDSYEVIPYSVLSQVASKELLQFFISKIKILEQ